MSLKLENETILLICLSEKWGTSERGVLRDCLMINGQGGSVFLFCLKDSFLDQEAKKNNVSVIHHSGPYGKGLLIKLNYYFRIKHILHHYPITLIHTYDLKSLWSLCSLLKRRPLIPLIYSRSTESKKNYKTFIHQLFFSRVDQILVPTKGLRDNVLASFPISSNKVEVMGLGLQLVLPHQSNVRTLLRNKLELTEKQFAIGCVIEKHEQQIEGLLPVLTAVSFLSMEGEGPIADWGDIKLLLICEKTWDTHLLYGPIKDELKNLGMEKQVCFHETHNLAQDLQALDLWVTLDNREFLSDHLVYAVSSGLPVVAPRRAGSAELLSDDGPWETYKVLDSRDLRFKCRLIMSKYNSYKKQDKGLGGVLIDKIHEAHSVAKYLKLLIEIYTRTHSKRLRFFGRKDRFKKLFRELSP